MPTLPSCWMRLPLLHFGCLPCLSCKVSVRAPAECSSLQQNLYRNNSPAPSHHHSPSVCEISAVRTCQAALQLCIAQFERSQTSLKKGKFYQVLSFLTIWWFYRGKIRTQWFFFFFLRKEAIIRENVWGEVITWQLRGSESLLACVMTASLDCAKMPCIKKLHVSPSCLVMG